MESLKELDPELYEILQKAALNESVRRLQIQIDQLAAEIAKLRDELDRRPIMYVPYPAWPQYPYWAQPVTYTYNGTLTVDSSA